MALRGWICRLHPSPSPQSYRDHSSPAVLSYSHTMWKPKCLPTHSLRAPHSPTGSLLWAAGPREDGLIPVTDQLLPCWRTPVIWLPRLPNRPLLSPRLSLKVDSISTFQKPAHPFRTCTSHTHRVNTTEAVTVCRFWNLGDVDLNPGSATFSGCSLTSFKPLFP